MGDTAASAINLVSLDSSELATKSPLSSQPSALVNASKFVSLAQALGNSVAAKRRSNEGLLLFLTTEAILSIESRSIAEPRPNAFASEKSNCIAPEIALLFGATSSRSTMPSPSESIILPASRGN